MGKINKFIYHYCIICTYLRARNTILRINDVFRIIRAQSNNAEMRSVYAVQKRCKTQARQERRGFSDGSVQIVRNRKMKREVSTQSAKTV